MSEVAEDMAPAPKAEEPRMVTINNVDQPLKDVLKAIKDRDLYNEADRRGLLNDDFFGEDCQGIHAGDLPYSVPDWQLRQNIPEALRCLERELSSVDSRFIGFADDVERHYARAA